MADSPSNMVIAFNIAKCLMVYYSIYYINSSICFGAFKLQTFDGKMPFDFKRWVDLMQCCVSYSKLEVANLIAMETTYFVSTWLFLLIFNRRFWDYVLTVTLIHVALSSLVMLSFPSSWSWWVCLALGVFMMLAMGEMVSYCQRINRPQDANGQQESPVYDNGLTFYPPTENLSEQQNIKA